MATEVANARNAHHLGPVAMNVQSASGHDSYEIHIARDFSRYPGGRYVEDGDFSGEEFREKLLVPALLSAREVEATIVVLLDGAAGYPASFLEEAFGGLVREHDFTARELRHLLSIRAGALFDSYRVLAERYIADARPKAVA